MSVMRRVARPALVLIAAVVIAQGCATACPAALLRGVLVADGPALAIRGDDSDFVRPIDWPFGHVVRSIEGRLVVMDWLGNVIAREGDLVQLPGGEKGSDGPWGVCGRVVVDSG